jgi:hypothetical protein
MVSGTRNLLTACIVGALILVPIHLYGQNYGEGRGNQSPPTNEAANGPPVAQSLVPEGIFASGLVKALKMGRAQNEAQAENMLSEAGIEPKNGWIADYPVTPDIIGEIQESVASSAQAKKLKMGEDEAQKAVENLVKSLALNVRAGFPPAPVPPGAENASTTIYKYVDEEGVIHFTDQYESIPKKYRNQISVIQGKGRPQSSLEPVPGVTVTNTAAADTETEAKSYVANANPEVIQNYYYENGPPVVTYYPPPSPYSYLYAWVPYPFWGDGFFFGGFFVLHDFRKHVPFHHHRLEVTNHVFHAASGRVFVVDPVKRSLRENMPTKQVPSPPGFDSAQVRSSARAIMAERQNRVASPNVFPESRMSSGGPLVRQTGRRGYIGRNHGANIPREMPAARGVRRSPPIIKNPRMEQRAFALPGNMGNRDEMNFRKPGKVRPRTFNPPSLTERSLSRFRSRQAQPSIRQVIPPSRAFSAPSARGRSFSGFRGAPRSFGGFQGGSSFDGQTGFSGFAGRR